MNSIESVTVHTARTALERALGTLSALKAVLDTNDSEDNVSGESFSFAYREVYIEAAKWAKLLADTMKSERESGAV